MEGRLGLEVNLLQFLAVVLGQGIGEVVLHGVEMFCAIGVREHGKISILNHSILAKLLLKGVVLLSQRSLFS